MVGERSASAAARTSIPARPGRLRRRRPPGRSGLGPGRWRRSPPAARRRPARSSHRAPVRPAATKPRQRVVRHRADRGHQAERDRQVVVAAFLGQVGRREVDGDAARRQRQARGGERRVAPARGSSATALSGRPTMPKAGSPARSAPARRPRAPRCPGMRRWKLAEPSPRRPRLTSTRSESTVDEAYRIPILRTRTFAEQNDSGYVFFNRDGVAPWST